MTQALIADDDPLLRRVLSTRLQDLGVGVRCAANGLEVLLRVAECLPDLLVLDVDMPAVGGMSVAESLRNDPRYSSIPIFALTGGHTQAVIDQCEALGVTYVHKGENAWTALHSAISGQFDIPELESTDAGAGRDWRPNADADLPPGNVEDCSETRPPRVLVIDDDFTLAKTLKTRLESLGIEVIRAYTGRQGYAFAVEHQPDIVITDYNMPDGRADYLINRLRQTEVTNRIPVIVLTGFKLTDGHNFGLARNLTALGACKFIAKPLNLGELVDALKHHIRLDTPATISV